MLKISCQDKTGVVWLSVDRSFLHKSLQRRCYPKRLADLVAAREEEERLKEEKRKQLELEREEALLAEEEASRLALEAAQAAEAAEAAEPSVDAAPFGTQQFQLGALPVMSASEVTVATVYPALPQAFATGLVQCARPGCARSMNPDTKRKSPSRQLDLLSL